MNQTSTPNKSTAPRKKRAQISPVAELAQFIKKAQLISTVVEPTENDLYDELSRMDSFSYGKYSN